MSELTDPTFLTYVMRSLQGQAFGIQLNSYNIYINQFFPGNGHGTRSLWNNGYQIIWYISSIANC